MPKIWLSNTPSIVEAPIVVAARIPGAVRLFVNACKGDLLYAILSLPITLIAMNDTVQYKIMADTMVIIIS